MRIDLRDSTFIIPVRHDHQDRTENLRGCLGWIRERFQTKIILLEAAKQGEHKYYSFAEPDIYMPVVEDGPFHRTAHLNRMAQSVQTKVLIIHDCDIIIDPPSAIKQAQDEILNGNADFVWPFNTQNHLVPRGHKLYNFLGTYDETWLRESPFTLAGQPPGGSIVCSVDSFWEAGGENENIVSWGPDDQERRHRWLKLGYRLHSAPGTIFHLEHYRGPDSRKENPNYQINSQEFDKIQQMSKEELKNYVRCW